MKDTTSFDQWLAQKQQAVPPTSARPAPAPEQSNATVAVAARTPQPEPNAAYAVMPDAEAVALRQQLASLRAQLGLRDEMIALLRERVALLERPAARGAPVTTGYRPLRLRFAGSCSVCQQSLAAGSAAYYSASEHKVRCTLCQGGGV